jgi:Trk-type K+ transport system membrane component
VRGYAVFRTAAQLIDLQTFSLDTVTTFAVCVLLIGTRSAAAQVHAALRSQELMHAAHSVGDVVFVASVNVLLQQAAGDSGSAPVAVRLLRVSFVCVLVYRAQDVLQGRGAQSQGA